MGKWEKVTGTICNITVDNINVTNLLPRTVESNRLLIVKLKRKVECRGHVLFEAVRSGFLRKILSSLKKKIVKTLYSQMIWKKLFPGRE